jgi:serine protease Do
MSSILSELSTQVASAIDRAAASIVQVHGHRSPTAGVVFADDLIVAPARALPNDAATVRLPNGNTVEGVMLGHALSMGIGVVRVQSLGVPPLATADEPKVGHFAISVGRTWSGAVFASVTNVAVVGGPLRTSRVGSIDRVIRVAQPPHGALTGGALIDGDGRALGLITASDIRGTTIVLPAASAWAVAQAIVQQGGTRQGFLGISSSTVALPERQKGGRSQDYGLLVSAVGENSPAERAGLMVGDVIVAFDDQKTEEPEALLTLLRGDRVGKSVTLTVIRGVKTEHIAVTVGERPRGGREGRR